MGEERKIYPLKFCSIRDERPWGYEEFKLADLGYKDSLIREGWLAGNSMGELMDTYIDRIVGDTVYEYYGRQFPVCVRLLRLTGKMPLQVHPDDETAEQRYDLLGKEKLWYILKAGKGGRLHIGFRKDTDAGAFCENCGADRADTMLTDIVPVEGQSFLIPAGSDSRGRGRTRMLQPGVRRQPASPGRMQGLQPGPHGQGHRPAPDDQFQNRTRQVHRPGRSRRTARTSCLKTEKNK